MPLACFCSLFDIHCFPLADAVLFLDSVIALEMDVGMKIHVSEVTGRIKNLGELVCVLVSGIQNNYKEICHRWYGAHWMCLQLYFIEHYNYVTHFMLLTLISL